MTIPVELVRMTFIQGSKFLSDGKLVWLVWAWEANERNPERHVEHRIEWEGGKEKLFQNPQEAREAFEAL